MKLNDWRKLAVFLVALWAIGVSTTLAAEFFFDKNVIFTYRMLPKGTIFEEGKVTMPDGKEFLVNTLILLQASPKPWEIDWTRYSEIPQYSVVKWEYFLVAAFVVPLLVWSCTELLTVAVSWVAPGSESQKALPNPFFQPTPKARLSPAFTAVHMRSPGLGQVW